MDLRIIVRKSNGKLVVCESPHKVRANDSTLSVFALTPCGLLHLKVRDLVPLLFLENRIREPGTEC
jgi:hypothetical protein